MINNFKGRLKLKEGFTLIELIAVLVILTVIMLIAIPSIASAIERSKQKQYEKKVDIIEAAANLFVSDNRYKITSSTCYISIPTLQDAGLLSSKDLDNPIKNNTKITGYVRYTRIDGSYVYVSNSEGSEFNNCFSDEIPTETVDPSISLAGIPNTIASSISYNVPTSYSYGSTGSGSYKCTVGSTVITNTSGLALGNHTINCTITADNGRTASATKDVSVVSEPTAGTYELEVAGAVGGACEYEYIGGNPGKGGYIKAQLYLNSDDIVNICAGGAGRNAGMSSGCLSMDCSSGRGGYGAAGGFNDGGKCGDAEWYKNGSYYQYAGGAAGGGTSDSYSYDSSIVTLISATTGGNNRAGYAKITYIGG